MSAKDTTKKTGASKKNPSKKDGYIEGVGRRKSSTARVRIYESTAVQSAAKGNIEVNGKPYQDYFQKMQTLVSEVLGPLEEVGLAEQYRATVIVKGGGIHSQSTAVRHGMARALLKVDEGYRLPLKAKGFLKRDDRQVERKKPGLKKARRAPQWSKR